MREDARVTRPDVSERHKRRRQVEYKMVKMRLSTWCSDAAIREELDIIARGVSTLTIEVSRFVNLWALMAIQEGDEIPEMDQTFFYRAMKVLCGSDDAMGVFTKALSVYDPIRPVVTPPFQTAYVNQVINEAGKDYMVACRNHVVHNMERRVGKAFSLFLEDTLPGIRAADRRKLSNHLLGRLSGRNVQQEESVWNSLQEPVPVGLREPVSTYMAEEEGRNLSLDESSVERNWWKYLPWLQQLQVVMEDFDARRFSLLPLGGFDLRHIRITNTILFWLIKRIRKRDASLLGDPGQWKEFQSNSRHWWEALFRVKKVERAAQQRVFEGSFMTDGYAATIVVSVPSREDVVNDSVVDDAQTNPEEAIHIDPTNLWQYINSKNRIVSVDPGSRDIVTCLSFDRNGHQVTWRFSKKEWETKIGVREAQRRRRVWIRKAGLEEEMLHLPSGKTGDLEWYKFYLYHTMQILPRILSVTYQTKVRALRFRQFGRKQKVMKEICQRITTGGGFQGDNRTITIAYGNATFSSRGSISGPVKAIRRELKTQGENVQLVNEAYTSMLCSSCHQRLEPMFGEDGRAIHAVRRCTFNACNSMVWHRDVNACLNIMYLYIYECINGFRPAVFTRAYQQQQQ